MVALKVANKVFLLSLSICSSGSAYKDKRSFPSIRDVISFERTEPPDRDKVELESEMTIDIEKLDIHRLKQDDTAFRNQLMGGLGGNVLLQMENTRRQSIPYYGDRPQEFFMAYERQYRTKMADVMLQLIYMARAKIRNFSAQGHIKTESTAYRVGYIIRKMEDLLFRSRRYYITMVKRQMNGKWDTESTSILNIHHKVVMMHHDFMRLFYIQMELHQRYETMEGKALHTRSEVESTTL